MDYTTDPSYHAEYGVTVYGRRDPNSDKGFTQGFMDFVRYLDQLTSNAGDPGVSPFNIGFVITGKGAGSNADLPDAKPGAKIFSVDYDELTSMLDLVDAMTPSKAGKPVGSNGFGRNPGESSIVTFNDIAIEIVQKQVHSLVHSASGVIIENMKPVPPDSIPVIATENMAIENLKTIDGYESINVGDTIGWQHLNKK